MQSYEGYFDEQGIFISQCGEKIPENKRTIVTVLNESAASREEHLKNQWDAIEKFLDDLKDCNEEVPDFERLKLRPEENSQDLEQIIPGVKP